MVLLFCSAARRPALVTGIYLILPMIDETIIKMFVDTAIFFPAYFIEKKWVHKK